MRDLATFQSKPEARRRFLLNHLAEDSALRPKRDSTQSSADRLIGLSGPDQRTESLVFKTTHPPIEGKYGKYGKY